MYIEDNFLTNQLVKQFIEHYMTEIRMCPDVTN